MLSSYANGWATGVDAALIDFGGPGIGVNKQTLGNIPTGSLILGRASPNTYTAIVDYYTNPVLMVNGNGATTINGGYNGISLGGSVGSAM